VTAVADGSTVNLEVDAYPGESFVGQVRFVSPALRADTRSLIVEAVVANADGRLKPGLFATARIEQAEKAPALLVPASAIQKTATATRVFVVSGDRVEERLVTLGQEEGNLIEATSGLTAGERVVTGGIERLRDGARIRAGS
jgi:membrane fusion protein (multidrug efflux system)